MECFFDNLEITQARYETYRRVRGRFHHFSFTVTIGSLIFTTFPVIKKVYRRQNRNDAVLDYHVGSECSREKTNLEGLVILDL